MGDDEARQAAHDARWAEREAYEQRMAEEEAARTPEQRMDALRQSGVLTADDGYPALRVASSRDVAWAVAEIDSLRATLAEKQRRIAGLEAEIERLVGGPTLAASVIAALDQGGTANG